MRLPLDKILFIAIIIGLILFPSAIFSQGAPPPPTPTGVPIDGGISALIGGMVAYGLYKNKQKKD